MKRVVIVVPIYKEILDLVDVVSLKRLNEICGEKYDIVLVSWDKNNDGKSFDYTEYFKIFNNESVKCVKFDNKYFANTIGYSQLLINAAFYRKFAAYEYMLIYQTDCYIVSDDIEKWCDKGYDYIGAPVISNFYVWRTSPTVGNGGCSLRKVDTFIKMTDPSGDFLKEYGSVVKPETVDIEDLYFCETVYQYYDFKRPRWREASSFGVDMNPDIVKTYIPNDGMPMVIHAWDKNIYFWKKYITEFDNPELITLCDVRWENDKLNKCYYNTIKTTYGK